MKNTRLFWLDPSQRSKMKSLLVKVICMKNGLVAILTDLKRKVC